MRIGKKKERDHPKWMYSRWVDIVPFGGHALRLTYDERNNLLSVGGAYLDYDGVTDLLGLLREVYYMMHQAEWQRNAPWARRKEKVTKKEG